MNRVLLAVECKNLHKTSPLVLCGRLRIFPESYYNLIELSTPTDDTTASIKRVLEGHFYKQNQFVGKSIHRIKRKIAGEKIIWEADSGQDIYDSWAQALSSSVELAESAFYAQYKDYVTVNAFIMPIVVVPDERLWVLEYNGGGQISGAPIQVEECEYFVDRRFELGIANPSSFALTHVHFATLTGFSKLLDQLWNASVWESIFSTSVDEAKQGDADAPKS